MCLFKGKNQSYNDFKNLRIESKTNLFICINFVLLNEVSKLSKF